VTLFLVDSNQNGVLYQNDDYGKDFPVGLKAALVDKTKVVAEVAYQITEPTTYRRSFA